MKKNRSKKWFILPIAAIFTYGITVLAFRFPSVTEKVYSQFVYPFIARLVSPFSNIFPFSIDDTFYILLIVTFLILLVLLIIKKISFAKAGKIILNVLAATYILFYLLWGFNYFREDLNTRLNLEQHEANTKAFITQLKNIVENTNKSWVSFENWNVESVDQNIEESFRKLAPVLKIKYPSGKRKPKSITVSRFFAQAGISGYYGPFFNEVHVNSYILPVEYPFILAHEKAHQFGITNEAEANFYAWLVCTKSNSKLLQYSANLHVLQYFLYQGYQLEEYPDIIAKLDNKG